MHMVVELAHKIYVNGSMEYPRNCFKRKYRDGRSYLIQRNIFAGVKVKGMVKQ